MKLKIIALMLAVALLAALLPGCGEAVGEIASNVASAAVKELEVQIKKTMEEYKVEVVELKSAVGKLDDDSDSEMQFFCGVLVRSNSDVFPQSGAAALGKIFDAAGVQRQTKSEIDNDHLVNKKITFKHSDFDSGKYYMIWVYTASFKDNLVEKLSSLELPTLPENWLPASETEAGVG